ncbi:MAG: type II 3-dehydroquinate dehydratase [bacterium]|nr:type II 3-dehydroquinate dehydratase [bacterium]
MILGGPNLSRLGQREPEIYGKTSWEELSGLCSEWANSLDLNVEFLQDDGEGALVGLIHQADDQFDGLILNAAAYTHTSVALRDAVSAVSIPVVEIHLSNPSSREEFRQKNLLSGVVEAGVFGFGTQSYRLALEGMAELLGA